jgi:amino acid adenylation domain-containing protein
MRIALIGRGAFGEAVLERLLQQGEEIVCVSAPRGAPGASEDALFARARALGLPVFATQDLAQPDVSGALLATDPELNVMAYVTTILPEALLHAPRLGSIEYHPSLLPRHRGASAVNWAIIQGEAKTGFSIFWPDEVVDGGPLLLQREVAIEPSDNAGTLLARLFPLGVAGLAEAVALVRAGQAPRIPQSEADATTEPRLRAGDGWIDFHKPARRVHDFVRGLTPRPGARTSLRGLTIEVLETALDASTPCVPAGEPGTIWACDDQGVLVACAGGGVRLTRLRIEPIGRCTAALVASTLGLQPGEVLGEAGNLDGSAARALLEAALGSTLQLAASAPGALCRSLEEGAPERRLEIVCEGLVALAAAVLRVPRSELTPQLPLQNVGLDSILAVELRARVELALRASVPASLFLQGLPVGELCRELLVAWERRSTQALDEPSSLQPDAATRFEPFPLTDIQHSYWVGRQGILPWGNLPTHLYAELDGALDPPRLGKAWAKMIERHDALRLVVQSDGRQRVLEHAPPYQLEIVDLRHMKAEQAEARIEALRLRMTRELPDVEWPRFEIVLQLLPAGRTRLHFNLDMLIADMFSVGLLFEDWGQLYEQPEAALPALEVSFRDYVLAERRLLEGQAGQAAAQHWRDRIPSLPPSPALPKPYRVDLSQARVPRIEHHALRLAAAEWAALRGRAKAHGLTPAVVLCSALCEILGYFCDRQRHTLNLTQARRLPLHRDIGRVVGDFTSTLLLECDWSGEGSFVERAQRLARQLWSDLNHLLVCGVEVLQQMEKSPGEVLMPVVLTSALNDLSTMNWAGALQSLIIETSQVYFDNRIHECNGELLVYWDIVPEFFPPGLIADMFHEYRGLLTRLARGDSETWQGSRRALTDARWRAAAAYNDTARSLPDELLHTLGRRHVLERPDAPAVISPERELSYRELYARAAALGLELRERGVRPNQLVAVMTRPGWQRAVAALGVLESGAAYLPIDPALPPERQRHLLESGAVQVAVSHASARPLLALPPSVALVDVDALGELDGGFLEPVQTPEDLAYVIHTSGSSGTPKGVALEHRGPVNTILDVNRRFSIGPDDRVLALSNLSFDLSVWDIFGLLAAGGTVVYPPVDAHRDPVRWLEAVRRCSVSVWNSVPALFELFVTHLEGTHGVAPECLRLALLSGDWIPVALPDRARSFLPDLTLISLGGATEAAIWSIFHPIGEVDPSWTSIPYGRPLANQRFYVLNERLEPCPSWTAGQLHIAGVGLAQGYWGDAATTARRFITHPETGERLYATGDRGRFTDRGDIEFLGREDTQVKIQGYRIELGEIEATLQRHPAVQEARVLVFDAAVEAAPMAACKPRSSERYLVAYVRRASLDVDEAVLLSHARETLPDYMLPSRVLFVSAWPLTANGKLDLSGLPRPDQRAAAHGARVRPETALELTLVEIWAQVLGCDPDTLGTTDNFFERGGNSLRLVKAAAEISERTGRECRIADLFQHATIQGMARALAEQAAPAVRAVQQRARERAAKRASLRT